MAATTDRPDRKEQGRTRPTDEAWRGAVVRLLAEHADHAMMPIHVLDTVGSTLGVDARSVLTRYGISVRRLAESDPFELTTAMMVELRAAIDFSDAYGRLSRLYDDLPTFAVVERALWADRSSVLVGLRTSERRRRQALAESGSCSSCAADAALAA